MGIAKTIIETIDITDYSKVSSGKLKYFLIRKKVVIHF